MLRMFGTWLPSKSLTSLVSVAKDLHLYKDYLCLKVCDFKDNKQSMHFIVIYTPQNNWRTTKYILKVFAYKCVYWPLKVKNMKCIFSVLDLNL